MNRQQMEDIWHGKIVNPNKRNSFKQHEVFTWRLNLYKKELIDTFELSEPHKNEKLATYHIQHRLQEQLNQKYPDKKNLTWQYQRVYS